jgi:L,D-peptidoglycan transpeptidase YkuD (ErfK/YbiS/YcfS/YnhG family)
VTIVAEGTGNRNIRVAAFLAAAFPIGACLTVPTGLAAQESSRSPIPGSSSQLIVVVSASFDADHGTLHRFEREAGKPAWRMAGGPARVTLGRNGLGLGIGLHEIGASGDGAGLPVKREGDGKSPAGVFRLSSAFGYAPAEQMQELSIPYTHVTEQLECVDDANSAWYNQVVSRGAVEDVDWQSSEQMLMDGIWYEQGIVVDHNTGPASPGAGSCIFLHNWTGPTDTTSGCTAMDPAILTGIVRWIDASRDPILVQFTEQMYGDYKAAWGLPDLSALDD